MFLRDELMKYLEDLDPTRLLVMADWLEDHCSYRPEVDIYVRRLRQPSSVHLRTLLDVVGKFGTPKERRMIHKDVRSILRALRTSKNSWRWLARHKTDSTNGRHATMGVRNSMRAAGPS